MELFHGVAQFLILALWWLVRGVADRWPVGTVQQNQPATPQPSILYNVTDFILVYYNALHSEKSLLVGCWIGHPITIFWVVLRRLRAYDLVTTSPSCWMVYNLI